MTTATAHRSYTWYEVWSKELINPDHLTPSQKKLRVKFLWLEYINRFDKLHRSHQNFNREALEDFANAYGIPDLEKAKRIVIVGYKRHMKDWEQIRKMM